MVQLEGAYAGEPGRWGHKGCCNGVHLAGWWTMVLSEGAYAEGPGWQVGHKGCCHEVQHWRSGGQRCRLGGAHAGGPGWQVGPSWQWRLLKGTMADSTVLTLRGPLIPQDPASRFESLLLQHSCWSRGAWPGKLHGRQ